VAGPHICIVAGEVSGDHQGGLLVAALRRLRPGLRFSGAGGPEMAAAGVDVEVDSGRWGVIGYAEAYARLPERFRKLCEALVIQVDDFATEEVLDHMEAESEFDLMGLFQGVGLPFRSDADPVQMPNMIWLYRRPILDYWAEHDETLGHIVRHVLIHEIGHHFGLSDADMETIEAKAD